MIKNVVDNMAKQRAQWVEENLESALAFGKMKADKGNLIVGSGSLSGFL
jgi:hypothetical protein